MEKQKIPSRAGASKVISTLIVCIALMMSVPGQAQNLLEGWNVTSGTPYDAGWRVDKSVSVTWGQLNGADNRYRTNVGTPASNGADPMLYITAKDIRFGYPVTPAEHKIYQLSGKAWRRNGGTGSMTFNFYMADNLLATNPASKVSLTVSGNNAVKTFSGLRLAVPEGFTSGYFLWEAHDNSANWQETGIWALQLTELGNAIPVTFDTGGGSSAVTSQYFLEGESYKITRPADPSREDGSSFVGWCTDDACTALFDFSTSVTAATTLYAKWDRAGVNLLSRWDGNGMGTTTDVPDAFGWVCSSAVTWVDASDGNDNYAYRYRDNFGSGVGRALTHPQDDHVFSFPVNLTGGKVYNFTCRNANVNHTCTTMFGINTSRDAGGTMLNSQSKTSAKWTSLTTFDFNFTATESATYYLVWQTTNGKDRNLATDFMLTEVGNAAVVTFDTDGGSEVPRQYFTEGTPYAIALPADPTKAGYLFAGWYTSREYAALFNFNAPVSADTTLYARFVPEGNPTVSTLTISGEVLALESARYMNITMSGTSELHLSADAPLVGSTVNLASDDAWLYLESVKPSTVAAQYLSSVTIGGQAFDASTDRMAIYGSGTVIIPNGKVTAAQALTAYKGEEYADESMTFAVDRYYRTAELGTFDNHIRSFKLKKGYSCTFANNPDGTGFSRVYIASDADVEVSAMPEGLEFVSFVRVCRWEWVGKKGICNAGLAALTDASWFNDWGAGAVTDNPDFEYVPMRHNLGWDSFETINSRTNVSHVLGFNEPDHADQANCTPLQAIGQWPELFKSGLRLGSPTPDAIRDNWLVEFLALADSLNYRVDFVVGHMYWNSQSGQNLYNGVTDACTRLYGGRPMWITEWNNGANWTNESWPTAKGPQRDADLNVVKDADGKEIIVNRPLSPENSAKQEVWIVDALDGLDRCEFLERHSLYNYVQDARAMALGDKLTPAGKRFKDYKSKVGFSKAREYVHVWKIAPPLPRYVLSKDYKSITLSWYDHNGETGKNYTLQKRVDGGEWTNVKVFTAAAEADDENSSVYAYGSTVSCTEVIDCVTKVDYRVVALSYKGTSSLYSRTVSLTRDAVADKPVLQGEALSTKIIRLTWADVDNARAYRLERAASEEGEYTVIADALTATTYTDENLAAATPYYYRLSALSTAATEPVSDVLSVSTRRLTQPAVVSGLRIASGDGQLTLTWDFAYDTQYRVLRAGQREGDFTTIASNVDATRYADGGLTAGTTYYYKIQPFNAAGDGPVSPVLSAKPVEGQRLRLSFNEAAGITAYDTWGGYHATLKEGAEWVDGPSGHAVALTKSKQSYLQLPDDALSNLTDFTLATRVNFNGSMGRLFDFGTGTASFMMLAPAKAKLRYKITCAKGTFDITLPCTINTQEWMHFAMTQQGTAVNFYLNGELVGTGKNTEQVSPADLGVTTRNYLGRSQWASDAYCDHIYDDFRLYNRALTAQEVARLAAGTVTLSVYRGSAEAEEMEIDKAGTELSGVLTGNDVAVAEEAFSLPEGQSNVIMKNANGTYACANLLLTDRKPFYSPVAFTATSAVYRRDLTNYTYANGIEGWSSLVLPFSGTLYAGEDAKQPFTGDNDASGNYWLKTFAGRTAETMNFDYATDILANTPYIIALPGNHWGTENSMEKETIEVRAENAVVSSTTAAGTVSAGTTESGVAPAVESIVDGYSFCGTYAAIAPAGSYYSLNAEGSSFVMQNAGVQVEPFRCYLLPDASVQSQPKLFSIGGGEITGVEMPDAAGKLRVYTADGNLMIVSPAATTVAIYGAAGMLVRTVQVATGVNTVSALASGFYIVQGQKVVIYSK